MFSSRAFAGSLIYGKFCLYFGVFAGEPPLCSLIDPVLRLSCVNVISEMTTSDEFPLQFSTISTEILYLTLSCVLIPDPLPFPG